MHGMKKKRVPRRVGNPIEDAIRFSQPIQGKDLADLRKKDNAAIGALARGEANHLDWQWLSEMVNVAEVMAKDGMGVELIPIAAEAQVLLAKVYVRRKKEGTWTLTPDEVWGMREFYEWQDLQRQSVPLGVYKGYLKRAQDINRTGNSTRTPEQLLEQVDGL